MEERNYGVTFNEAWIRDVHINLAAVKRRADSLSVRRGVKKEWQAAWQIRAVSCIDLTTLAGDDTPGNVARLCYKAVHPVQPDLLLSLDLPPSGALTTAAVCVYANRVADCRAALGRMNASLPIASVATGFPAGQTPLEARLKEIEQALLNGASEIDIVINRTLALRGDWSSVYDEVKEMRVACKHALMKAILATGDLGGLGNVYRASMTCMMAGADFVKTSTGKEAVNATLPVALVMLRAIRDFHAFTGHRVGFKPAGGIRTAKEACLWLTLMKEELGDRWTQPDLFRIGASSLLGDLERQIAHYATGSYVASNEMPLA